MSPYTEAHFAATLLYCGPHISRWKVHTPAADSYLNQVYEYFFMMFPKMVTLPPKFEGQHEWHIFWREYLDWVES